MSTTDTSGVRDRVDAELDGLQREREQVMASAPGRERSQRMAELYELEAGWWSVLFEHARARVHWRAALAAEAHAKQCAQHWRRRAAAEAAAQEPAAELDAVA